MPSPPQAQRKGVRPAKIMAAARMDMRSTLRWCVMYLLTLLSTSSATICPKNGPVSLGSACEEGGGGGGGGKGSPSGLQ